MLVCAGLMGKGLMRLTSAEYAFAEFGSDVGTATRSGESCLLASSTIS